MNTNTINFTLKKSLRLLLAIILPSIIIGAILYLARAFLPANAKVKDDALFVIGYTVAGLWAIRYLLKKEEISVKSFFDFTLKTRKWFLGNIVFIVLCTFFLDMFIEPISIWVPNYDTPMPGWVLLSVGCIIAPIIEEVLLRGIGMSIFLRRVSPVKAIVITSVLFGLIHINPAQVVAATFSGLFLGWIYYKTKNLLFSILVHATSNMMAFLSDVLPVSKYSHLYQCFPNVSSYLVFYVVSVVLLIVGLYYYGKFIGRMQKTPVRDISI